MENHKGASKVPKKKLEKVKQLAAQIDKTHTLGIVNLKNLPARQLGYIRNKVRDKIQIRMAKKSVLERAIKSSKNKHASTLLPYLKGMPALLFTDLDPFMLFQKLKENQSPAAAKVGQICPRDVEVKAGPTSLTPGPAISTLSNVGLQAGVEGGKIAIKQAKIIVREGEELKQNIVNVLNLLNIKPMVIGINLVAALEGGEVYERKILDIDIEDFKAKIASAHSDAFKLAIGAGMALPETASFLITKAELEAKALAREAGILNKDTAGDVLAKAEAQASALNQTLNNQEVN